MTTVLVTGATGFVGHHLAIALLGRGHHVRALVRDRARAGDLERRGVELVVGDLRADGALAGALAGVERVYHCAALVGDWLDAAEARRVNVEGTRRVLAASQAAGARRFVHLSSLAVLGTRHHRGTDETGPYAYGDPYTDTKIDSERLVLAANQPGGLETVALRPGFIYGPGDHQLLPRLMEALATGQFLYVGDGGKEMNSIYVDDVVSAMLAAGEHPAAPGQAFNIADGANTTLREFVTGVATALDMPPPTRRLPVPVAFAACATLETLARLTRATQPPRLNRSRLRFLHYNQRYSIEKARRVLGWSPRVTYREGLPPTLAWFRDTGRLPRQLAAAPAYTG